MSCVLSQYCQHGFKKDNISIINYKRLRSERADPVDLRQKQYTVNYPVFGFLDHSAPYSTPVAWNPACASDKHPEATCLENSKWHRNFSKRNSSWVSWVIDPNNILHFLINNFKNRWVYWNIMPFSIFSNYLRVLKLYSFFSLPKSVDDFEMGQKHVQFSFEVQLHSTLLYLNILKIEIDFFLLQKYNTKVKASLITSA